VTTLSQYAYFAITSTALDPDQITARLGVAPDKVRIRGSKQAEPPVPRTHSWQLHADGTGRLDEQLATLVARLRPIQDPIRQLIAEGNLGYLQVVRNFGEGEPEAHPELGPLRVLSGQHQLLGWHLDRTLIAFLAETGLVLDVDEYG
jgi:hypothetical protein